MWQNLRIEGCAESVHLTEYPVPKDHWIDSELSDHMESILRLVSLGLAARNAAGHKIRQPLAELRVDTHTLHDLDAVVRFEEQILDEINVKRVSLHIPEEQLSLVDEAKRRFRPTSRVATHVDKIPAAGAIPREHLAD